MFEFQSIIRIMHENDYIKALGFRIKTLRKDKKLSQATLAEKIDKSVDTVSNLERGLYSPRLDTALEIATQLDVNLYELFQVQDIPTEDRNRAKIIAEIVKVLRDQPEDILKFSLNQTKDLVQLKEQFVKKLMN